MVKGKKKGGMKKMKGGIAIAPIIAGVTAAHGLAKQYKPASKLTDVLNAAGLETDPNKLSGIRKAGAYVLKGMRDWLGWGPMGANMIDARAGRSGNQLMGQSMVGGSMGGSMNMIQGEMYGTPTMKKYTPQSTNGISGSGKKRRTIKL